MLGVSVLNTKHFSDAALLTRAGGYTISWFNLYPGLVMVFTIFHFSGHAIQNSLFNLGTVQSKQAYKINTDLTILIASSLTIK